MFDEIISRMSQEKITEIDLSYSAINDEDVFKFISKIKDKHPLKRLNLSYNNIKNLQTIVLLVICFEPNELVELNFSGNPIDLVTFKNEIHIFIKKICDYTKLTQLDFSHCGLEDKEAALLCNELFRENNPHLHHINLSANYITNFQTLFDIQLEALEHVDKRKNQNQAITLSHVVSIDVTHNPLLLLEVHSIYNAPNSSSFLLSLARIRKNINGIPKIKIDNQVSLVSKFLDELNFETANSFQKDPYKETITNFLQEIKSNHQNWHILRRALITNSSFTHRMGRALFYNRSDFFNTTDINLADQEYLWSRLRDHNYAFPITVPKTFSDLFKNFQSERYLKHYLNLWSGILFIFLFRDSINYCVYPNFRYGHSYAHILLGQAFTEFSAKSIGLSSNLGGNLVETFFYWPGVVLMLSAALIVPLSSKWLSQPVSLQQDNLENMLANLDDESSFLKDGLARLIPFANWNETLNRLKHHILWNGTLTLEQRIQIIKEFKALALKHGWLTRWIIIDALAEIADHFYSLAQFGKDSNANPLHIQNAPANQTVPLIHQPQTNYGTLSENQLHLIGKKAWRALEKVVATQSGSKFAFINLNLLHALYNRWFIDLNPRHSKMRWFTNTLFALFALSAKIINSYFKLRFIQIVMEKFYFLGDDLLKRVACEASNQIWLYRSMTGEYDCTICGHWPSVFYLNANDSQACFNGFSSRTQTAIAILKAFEHLLPHSATMNQIDLSKQDWINWPNEIFDTFLQKISMNAKFKTLHTLNLSGLRTTKLKPLQKEKFKILGEFFKKMPVKHLILNQIPITFEEIQMISDGLCRHDLLEGLEFSDNGLQDTETYFLKPILAANPIAYLKLSGNNITDSGMLMLAQGLSSGRLSQIDLRNNYFRQIGLDILGEIAANNPLNSIIIAENNFENLDFSHLIAPLSNRTITLLDISSCRMSSLSFRSMARAFNGHKFNILNLSENSFQKTDIFIDVITGLMQCSTDEMDLSQCGLSKNMLKVLSEFVTQTPLKIINLTNNKLNDEALTPLIDKLSGSQINQLVLDNNLCSDALVESLMQNLATGNNTVLAIDLNNAHLTEASARAIGNHLQNTSVTSLSLVRDHFHNPEIALIATAKNLKQLKEFDVSMNGMSSITNIINHLPESTLEKFMLNGNLVPVNEQQELIKTLIEAPIDKNRLGHTLSQDDAKALRNYGKPATKLKYLEAKNIDLQENTLKALCQIAPNINMRLEDMVVDENPWSWNDINLQDCEIIPRTRASEQYEKLAQSQILFFNQQSNQVNNQPPFLSNLETNQNLWLTGSLFLPLFLLIFLIYKASPLRHACTNEHDNKEVNPITRVSL